MTELISTPAATPAGVLSLAEQWRFAETVAGSDIVPRAYRNDPGSVLVAVNLGASMGLSPAESLYRIHVIEGKPSAAAELIASNIRRAGHRLRVTGDDRRAVAQIVRADDPEFPFEAEWTIERAQRAGLTTKTVWKSYPAAMLRARAITECARSACPEALYGVAYTEEEAREAMPAPATSAPRPADRPAHVVARVVEAAADDPTTPQDAADPGAREGASGDTESPRPADPAPDVTKAQLGNIARLMGKAEITERAHALAYVGKVIGREIGSRSELTKAEASEVIDALMADVGEVDQ